VPEVQAALQAGTVPPERYRITTGHWNDAGWVEQPVTEYTLARPSEDVAEAISMYVARPELLRQRSPRRFQFLDTRKAALQPHLRRDASTVRLFLTPAEVQQALGQGAAPRWLQPIPPLPARPPGGEPPVQVVPGPSLQVRF
jgi:hypothetical protein